MKTAAYSILFYCLLLPGYFSAQVTIDGNLKLGDTSQILILQTKKGDQVVGSISSWKNDSLSFQMTTGNLLHLGMTEVEKIKVHEPLFPNNETDLQQGIITFYSEDGKVRKGHVVSMDRQGLRIKYDGKKRAFLSLKKFEKATFDPTVFYPEDNLYLLRLRNAKDVFGHFVYMDQKSVIFQPLGEKTYNFPRTMVNSMRRKSNERSNIGHQRALLLTPTGFNLSKGQSEFRNIDYFLNTFSTGFSDHLSGTVGLLGIEPYFQLKASQDVGKYFHFSAGGGISLSGATGWHTAVSIGEPDYYLNLGIMRNKGEMTFADTDMKALFFGASARVGWRQRLFGEFTHIIEREDLFETNGYGTNTFAFGWGQIGKRVSLNLALMMTERVYSDFCFGGFTFGPCNDEHYDFFAIPIISTSIFFGKME
jgi:hypothetical protein